MSSATQLSPRQRAGIAGLVSGLDKAEVAETLGIRPQTLSRWLRQPLFRHELAQAQDAAVGDVTRRISAGAGDMLAVLSAVAQDKAMPPAVRVRAALGWLAQVWKARELGELTERLAALETQVLEVGE